MALRRSSGGDHQRERHPNGPGACEGLPPNWNQVAEIVLMEASAIRRTPSALFVVPAKPAEFLATLSRLRRTHLRFSWLYLGVKFAVVVPEGVDIPLHELAEDIAGISGVTLRRK